METADRFKTADEAFASAHRRIEQALESVEDEVNRVTAAQADDEGNWGRVDELNDLAFRLERAAKAAKAMGR